MINSHNDNENLNFKIKIIIVDDSTNYYKLIEQAIEQSDCTCLLASNSEEALKLLNEHSDIDIIVLNLFMQKIDGLKFIKKIKTDIRNKSIPIFVISSDLVSIVKVLHLGVNDFTDKPFNIEEIAIRIKNLTRTKQELELKNLSTADFLTAASHELRTPLNGIYGLTDILQEQIGRSELHEHFGEMKDAISGLTVIINNLIDFCMVDALGAQTEKSGFNFHDIIEQTASSLTERTLAKSVVVKIEIQPDTPLNLLGYPDRLRRIISNLIDTSLKFAPFGGTVLVKVKGETLSTDQIFFTCTIKDNGIGIDATELEELFQPEIQGNGTGSSTICKHFGYVGIGLVVALKLARSIGGTIKIETDPGNGNTFILTFHAIQDTTRIDNRHHVNSTDKLFTIPSLKILLAEDNPVNQKVALWNLKKMGHHVDIAINGIEAIQYWQNESYDLIFMDLHMPKMDGFEATRIIRMAEKLSGSHIPVVALTAYSGEASESFCIKSGMDCYITKPVRSSDLECVIRQIMNRHLNNLF